MSFMSKEAIDFIREKNIIVVRQPAATIGIKTDRVEELLSKVKFPFSISSNLPIQVSIPQDPYFEHVILAQESAKPFTAERATFTAIVFTDQDVQLIDFFIMSKEGNFVLNINYKHGIYQQTLSGIITQCSKVARSQERHAKSKEQTPYDAFQKLGQHLLKEDVGARQATVTCITRLLAGIRVNDTDVPPMTYLQQLVATGVTRVAIGIPNDDSTDIGQVYIYDSASEEFQKILDGFQGYEFHELDIRTMSCGRFWG